MRDFNNNDQFGGQLDADECGHGTSRFLAVGHCQDAMTNSVADSACVIEEPMLIEPSPLSVQSEYDIRTAELAATAAFMCQVEDMATVNFPLLVQSDPALPSISLSFHAPPQGLLIPTTAYTMNSPLTDVLMTPAETMNHGQSLRIGNESERATQEDMSKYGGKPLDASALPTTAPTTSTGTVLNAPPLKRTPSTYRRVRNQSELEVNAQHYRIQRQYKQQRGKGRRRLTDIDFEGILRLIGGCSTWQLLIYVMISAHQVPHAMFNLSVVYFTYRPDHWCKIPVFNRENIEGNGELGSGWTWEKALASGIAFPMVKDHQRRDRMRHDQCSAYVISATEYRRLLSLNYSAAIAEVAAKRRHRAALHTARCTEWDYDQSVMISIVSQWHRVCDENWSRAHVHLSYSLGYLVGCLLGGFISDRYGRKPAIYGFSILSTIFGFLLAFSKEFEVFLVVRFLLAVCNEAADLAAYVYAMEITGVQYRSIVGSLLQAPWACGYAFLALVAYLWRSWKTIQLITTFMHFASLFLIHQLPESPRWLIVMGKVDGAERIIRKACHFNRSSLPSDLGLVRHAEMRRWVKHNERPHFLHSFKSQAMTIRNVIIFIVWIATALVYYGCVLALSDQSSPGRSMFGDEGSGTGNFFLNNAIAGAIELPTLMGCVFLLQYGRKHSQIITLISAGVLIFVAMCASLADEMTLSLIFMLAGKACIQSAFNILYIFTSELYPTVIRNTAVGTCSMVARIGAGASGYIAILSDVTLPTVPMAIFCIFSLFAGVLIYFLPETRDCPLPDTMWDAVTMLKNNNTYYKCAGGITEEAADSAPPDYDRAAVKPEKERKKSRKAANNGGDSEDEDDDERGEMPAVGASKR